MPPPLDRDPPEAAGAGEPRSWLLRFGGFAFAATLGSAMAAAPAALRLQAVSGVCGATSVWALLFAVAIAPMGLAVVGLRGARSGLASLTKSDGMTPAAMLVAWVVTCFVGLAL